MKKSDNSNLAIPGCLLLGIGIGFLLINITPVAIPAFTLIGLGIGMLITYHNSLKK